jgi:hypothetical protein
MFLCLSCQQVKSFAIKTNLSLKRKYLLMTNSKTFLFFFALILISGFSKIGFAQENWDMPYTVVGDSTRGSRNAIFTGIVTNGTSKEPLVEAHLSLDFFKYYGRTDQFGKFAIELPPGRYKLTVKYIGMKPSYFRLNILGSGLLNIAMEEGYELPEVEVSDRPLDSNIKEALAGLSKFTLKEIKNLPAFMGEVDILKSIQTLPGVTSVGEGSSGFNVRGGRSDQNLILLNGAPLFNSSHALGFVSGFNQDVITNFSLYKGNVPANFGGRASSVLEVNTKSGDFEKWQFQGGVGLISSRFLAEGPLVKNKSSILAAIRTSNSDWALKQAENPDVNRSAFNFYDANLTLVNKFNERSLLKLNIYSSNDFFRFSQRFGFEWQNFIANAEWKSRTDKKLSPTLNVAFGQYKSTLIDPSPTNPSQLKNNLIYYQIKETVDYIPNEIHSIKGGFESTAYLPKPEALSGYNGNTSIVEKAVDKNYGIESGIFINDEYKFSENISFSAGLRYSIYSQIGSAKVFTYQQNTPKLESTIIDTLHFSNGQSIKTYQGFEPRISGRFNLAESQSVKVSYNRMRQYIHQISNTTAPTPVDIWQVSTRYLPPQVADNFSVGYFRNLKDNMFETSVEFFYKSMNNLVEYKDFPTLYLNPHIETELLSGKGRAFGGEIYARKLKGKWTGWISYTYSQTQVSVASPNKSESINDGRWFASNYNKPHNFNIVGNRRLGKGAFSFIFTYTSGRPLTAVESSYITDGTVVPVYSQRNQYNIPDYIRLDVSFTIGNVFRKIEDSLVISFYNLLGRENAYSVFYQRPQSNFFIPKAYQLSVLGATLPSITYNFKF